jgi:hypothetical protein
VSMLSRRAVVALMASSLTVAALSPALAKPVKSAYPVDARIIAGFNIDTVTKAPLDILMQVHVKAPADKVWALVGDHKRLPEWHKAIAHVDVLKDKSSNRSFPVALTRVCTLDDKTLTEDIAFQDAKQMTYVYAINKDKSNVMVPMENHAGVFTVEALGPNDSLVSWRQFWDKGVMGLVAAPMMKAKYMDPAMQALIDTFGGEAVETQ